MAMNANQLESEIITALNSCGWDTSNEYSVVQCLAHAVAVAVVNHIQSNAVTSKDSESVL